MGSSAGVSGVRIATKLWGRPVGWNGIGTQGRGAADLLEVGRDGGEGEDLEAEDVEAVLRIVLHLVLLLLLPLDGAAGCGAMPDHEAASHHRVASAAPAWTCAAVLPSLPVGKDARDWWDLHYNA